MVLLSSQSFSCASKPYHGTRLGWRGHQCQRVIERPDLGNQLLETWATWRQSKKPIDENLLDFTWILWFYTLPADISVERPTSWSSIPFGGLCLALSISQRCDCFNWWRGVKNAFMSATEVGGRGSSLARTILGMLSCHGFAAVVQSVELHYVNGTAARIIDEMSPSSSSSKTFLVCKKMCLVVHLWMFD